MKVIAYIEKWLKPKHICKWQALLNHVCDKSMIVDSQGKSKFEPEFLGLQNADDYHLL